MTSIPVPPRGLPCSSATSGPWLGHTIANAAGRSGGSRPPAVHPHPHTPTCPPRFLGNLAARAQMAAKVAGYRSLLGLTLCASPAAATPMAPIPLTPPATRIGYTAFAMGVLPITAAFHDFSGTLIIDPGQPLHCQVQVTVRMASLHMDDPARNRLALSPAMLDAARYPTMRFAGHCAGRALVGDLTLHGVTHPLAMALHRQGRHVVAIGTLRRRDYAISSLSGVLSQSVRVRLDAQLPEAASALPMP